MGFSLIHPSRSRAQKSYNNINYWYKHYSGRIQELEIIVSIDNDDPEYHEYKRLHGENVISGDNHSAVDAINRAAAKSTQDILIVVSDDTGSMPSWNKDIYEAIKGKGIDWILKTQDGIQPWIVTSPVIDRTYYNRFGYIYHPAYKHMFCDTELTCVADLTGRKITSNILFKHNHYSVTKEPPDAISKRADATWDQGEKLFLERYKRNFDLPPDQIKGKIADNGMIRWLERKVRR